MPVIQKKELGSELKSIKLLNFKFLTLKINLCTVQVSFFFPNSHTLLELSCCKKQQNMSPPRYWIGEQETHEGEADLDLTLYKGRPSIKQTNHGVYGLVLKCSFICVKDRCYKSMQKSSSKRIFKKVASIRSRYDTIDGLDCMFFKKVIKKDEQIHYALSGGTCQL